MRCFFGIDMNPYSKELNKIDLPNQEGMFKAKGYHITLIFYEDFPEDKIKLLKDKFESFYFPVFSLEGDEIFAFPNKNKPSIYALSFKINSNLVELHKKLKGFIEKEKEYIFNPHITLLRKEKLPSNFKKSKEELKKIEPLKIEINSFGLYKSEPNSG